MYLTSCNANNLQVVLGSAQFTFPNTANYLIINVDSAALYNVSGYLAADRLPFTPFNSLLPTFAGATRSSSTGFSARAGGTTASTTSASVRTTALNEYVFARNNNGSVEFRSAASIAFYSIGSSLGPDPATGLALLDTLVSRLLADFRSIDEDGMDRDALAYIRNVEAADGGYLELGVKKAIDTFVRGCKYDGIWDSIKASCILCGARTLAGALTPLAGAAPSNNNFVDADYNRETGLKGNASTKYLGSNYLPNSSPQNDSHGAVFGSTLDAGPPGIRQWAGSTGATNKNLGLFHLSGQGYYNCNISTGLNTSTVHALANGFYGVSRTASAVVTGRNGGTDYPSTTASVAPTADNVFIFATNFNGSVSSFSDGRLQFYSLGTSLDLALMDNRVSTLVQGVQKALGNVEPDWTLPGADTYSQFAESIARTNATATVADVTTTPSGTYPGSNAFVGGVLLPDGRVFCVPLNSTSSRLYDPVADEVTTPTGTYPGSNAFAGGVLLPDGRVFCVPLNSTSARIYDPVADELTTPTGTYPGSLAFVGGVLLPDGRVFCVPLNSTSSRIYDPVADELTTPSGTYPGSAAFHGGVLLPDGKVYCVPRNSTTARIYDPVADTLTTPSGTYPGSNAFQGGVLLPDGRVFCVPNSSTTARIYDPVADTLTTPSGTYPGSNAFYGGVLLPDGKVYCVPNSSTSGRLYDPVADEVTTPSGTYPGSSAFGGGVLLPDGRVYCVRFNSTSSRLYGGGQSYNINVLLSAYLNKF